MIDAPVHAALVVVFTWLVNWAFVALGLDLGSEVATGLATVIVGYILSLFGLDLWYRATTKSGAIREHRYQPPFTS